MGAGLIWIFNIAQLFRNGDAWLALLYTMILSIPASALAYLRLRKTRVSAAVEGLGKWRSLLFSVQGAALAFLELRHLDNVLRHQRYGFGGGA